MRSFLAFVALLVGFLSATVSVVAYVAHETALDPGNIGDVMSEAVGIDGVRDEILSEAVPGYDRLPDPVRGEIDRLASSPRVDDAVSEVQVDESGRADLSAVGQELSQQLRGGGFDRIADRVEAASDSVVVRLPDNVWEPYISARDNSWMVAMSAGVAAVAAFGLALLVARNRRAAMSGVGMSLILSAGAALLLIRAAPALADMRGSDPWVQAGAAAMDPSGPFVQTTLIAVAVAGVLALLLSFAVPRPRR